MIHIFANPVYEKTLSLWKSFPFYTPFCSYPLLPNVDQANINITWQPLADNKNVRDPQGKHLHTFWRYQDSEIRCYSLKSGSLTNRLPIYGWQIDWHRNSVLYLVGIIRMGQEEDWNRNHSIQLGFARNRNSTQDKCYVHKLRTALAGSECPTKTVNLHKEREVVRQKWNSSGFSRTGGCNNQNVILKRRNSEALQAAVF